MKNRIIGSIILTLSRKELNVYIENGYLVFSFMSRYRFQKSLSARLSGWELNDFKKISLYRDNQYIRDEVFRFERDFNLTKLLDV